MKPLLLKDAPGGAQYLTASADTLRTGRRAFAENCASCHSSKQPPAGTADPAQWFREAVRARRLPRPTTSSPTTSGTRVMPIGTNIARALGDQRRRAATSGSSSRRKPTRSCRASAGSRTSTTRATRRSRITFEMPGGGRGYYRTASLTSIWATAPYLHNNSVGVFVKDPSVQGRMTAFNDGMQKMLWPERRLGVQSIPVTTVDSSVHDQRHRAPGANPRRDAGGLRRPRRSDAAARHRPQQHRC